MIRAEHVTYRYLGAEKPTIVDADVILPDGTVNLLWGDNGAGKSTLALILCGAIPHLIKGEYSGNVLWNGSPISDALAVHFSSIVFQNPYTYFLGYTLQEELNLASDRSELSRIAQPLLPNVAADTPLYRLSLGQQQRVAICSAILRQSPVVFLDEPFESLDDSAVEQAATLITNAAKLGKLVVIIHRPQQRNIIVNFNRSYGVLNSKVYEKLPATPDPLPTISKLSSGPPNLIIQNLSFTYRGNASFAIKEVGFSILEGESVGVIGPNGCGKTSLFMLVSGLLKPTSGIITIGRERLENKALRRKVKCAFQNPEAQIFSSTIEEELEFGLGNLNLDRIEIRRRLERASEYIAFDLSVDPFTLSYGQKKLLAIVATFLMEPKVILLDEPTAGMDCNNVIIFRDLAEAFLKNGGSLLISSHSISDIKAFSHRALVMRDGQLVEELRL